MELTLVEDTSILGTVYYDQIIYYTGSEVENFFPDVLEMMKDFWKEQGISVITGVAIEQAAEYATKKLVERGVKEKLAGFLTSKVGGVLLSVAISFDMFLIENMDEFDLMDALEESENGIMVITGHYYDMHNLGMEYPELNWVRREYENYEPWNNFYVDVPSGYEYSWTPGVK